GDPDRNARLVYRIRRKEAGEGARLLFGSGPLLAALRAGAAHVVAQLLRVRRALDQPLDERMLGREHEERRAEERVRPCREDGQFDVELIDAEEDLGAL